jgi:hypothetical protein
VKGPNRRQLDANGFEHFCVMCLSAQHCRDDFRTDFRVSPVAGVSPRK